MMLPATSFYFARNGHTNAGAFFAMFERDIMFYLIVPSQVIDFKAMFYCSDFLAKYER